MTKGPTLFNRDWAPIPPERRSWGPYNYASLWEAMPLCDARRHKSATGGCFLGPTVFDNVTPDMTIAKEEIFGPVLSVIRVKALDEAIQLVNLSPYSNATSISPATAGARASTPRELRWAWWIQCRHRRPHGLLPLRRMEEFLFRRPARPRQRPRGVLHRAETHHEPMVLSGRGPCPRST